MGIFDEGPLEPCVGLSSKEIDDHFVAWQRTQDEARPASEWKIGPFVDQRTASEYLGIPVHQLRLSRRPRSKVDGPTYYQFDGLVRYAVQDLQKWAKAHMGEATVPDLDELKRRSAKLVRQLRPKT